MIKDHIRKTHQGQREHNAKVMQARQLRDAGHDWEKAGKAMGVAAATAEAWANRPLVTVGGLSVRASKVLAEMLGKTEFLPFDVAQLQAKEILREPNAGKKTVEEIEFWLAKYGFFLGARLGRSSGTSGSQPQNAPLTAAHLADALGCFWNAAIGEAHNRQSSAAIDAASVMAVGLAAVASRLAESPPSQPEGMRDALIAAESFIRGFEDDDLQEGIPELLATIRAVIGGAQ